MYDYEIKLAELKKNVAKTGHKLPAPEKLEDWMNWVCTCDVFDWPEEPDPYAQDIWDDDTPVSQCPYCIEQSAMDI